MLITNDQIRQIAPSARESVITPFAIFFSKYAEKYEINSMGIRMMAVAMGAPSGKNMRR